MTRRRLRAWWGRRPFKARAYEHAHTLHRFEDEVILRKLGDASMTAVELDRENPELFVLSKLQRTLKRMHSEGKLERHRRPGRWVRGHGWSYKRKTQVQRRAV